MRKLAAAAVTAAAIAASLLAAGSADAASGRQVATPGFTALASTTTPTRIGKVHKFTVPSIKGAAGWGNWYWAKFPGQHAFVLLNLNIKDTRADGRNAALCFKLKEPNYAWLDRCIVNTKGSGKTFTQHWEMDAWNQTKLEVQNTTGRLDKVQKTFYVSTQGRWLKLHWV